jgi:rRNA maturation endonuclease Nob1
LDDSKRSHLSDEARAKTLVLDTSALIMGLNPSALGLPTYSVPSVAEELIPETLPYTRFGMSRDSGRLIVRKPTLASISIVHEISSKVGDVAMLSNADIDVLALALDLKKSGLSPAIVSDDYAIQNVCETLEIEHASLATFGIARKFDWIYYCPACFRRYRIEDADQTCSVCGTSLKRKVVKKTKPRKKISRNL